MVGFRTQSIDCHLDLKSSADDEEADASEGERGLCVTQWGTMGDVTVST
jgi:hypothetical protein